MTYKLALKLKKAGFPQEDWEQKKLKSITMEKAIEMADVRFPILEELIDACGDKFESMIKVIPEIVNKIGTTWVAYSNITDDGEVGKTPLIAVAKLYLKLNENN